MKTVTNGPWCVCFRSGGDLNGRTKLEVFRTIEKKDQWPKFLYADCHGKMFDSDDEAKAFALERGYLKTYSRVDAYGWNGCKQPRSWEMRMRNGRAIAKRKGVLV
jgi:hypothetical protein